MKISSSYITIYYITWNHFFGVLEVYLLIFIIWMSDIWLRAGFHYYSLNKFRQHARWPMQDARKPMNAPRSHVIFLTGFVLLTAYNWQKWKRVFLTCPSNEIYRDEAVGLKSCNYSWKITIYVNMGFGAISWKIDILLITA